MAYSRGKKVTPKDNRKKKVTKKTTGGLRPVSNIKQIQSQKRGLGKRDRLELAQSRSGSGQEHKLKDGKIVSTTALERRETEIQNIAQKRVDVDKAEEKIKKGDETITEPQKENLPTRETMREVLIRKGIAPNSTDLSEEQLNAEVALSGKEGELGEDINSRIDEIVSKSGVVIGSIGAVGAGVAAVGPTAAIATLWAVNEFILSPSELTEWTAVDNIAGVTSFRVSDLTKDIKFNGFENISPKEATEVYNTAQDNIDLARTTVNGITILNPKLWAGRKLKLAAIQIAQDSLDLARQQTGL